MRVAMKKRSKKAGLPPGTIVHIGEKKVERTRITMLDYDEGRFEQKEVEDIEELKSRLDSRTVTWINVDGLHDVELIERIGSLFGLHPLVLEDIVNTTQRPKVEDYGDYLFLVLRMFPSAEEGNHEKGEQVSFILGKKFVLSFQEIQGDVFEPIRDRIRKGKGRLRKSGPDYLAYSLLDALVDSYFLHLEKAGERIEILEEELLRHPEPKTMNRIHHLKREMIYLRKAVWPVREVIFGIQRMDSSLINETTGVFLRDVYDHTIQVIDTVETFRDVLTGMLDTYLSSVSNRMNEVMKVLTIIATIFIPLTFIAGIYGMNFHFMPELEWRWGYFLVLLVMLAVAVVMLLFFKKKKWL